MGEGVFGEGIVEYVQERDEKKCGESCKGWEKQEDVGAFFHGDVPFYSALYTNMVIGKPFTSS